MSNFDYNYHESFINKNISHFKNEISKVEGKESETAKQHLVDCSIALINFECLLTKLKESKVLEEKLRWIPVEEKLPPIDIPVILKYRDWEGKFVYQIFTLGSIERREHFLKTHLKFTEWRILNL